MEFTIDKNRLADYKRRFKTATNATNITADELKKAGSAVEDLQVQYSRLVAERAPKSRFDELETPLRKAKYQYDQAHARYVEAGRISGYFGAISGRCQLHATRVASETGADLHRQRDINAEAISNAAHAQRERSAHFQEEHASDLGVSE